MLKVFRAGSSMLKRTRNLLVSRPKPNDTDGFFFPDSGRWLWNEECQRARHTRRFNVRALEDVVATTMGAQPGTGVVRFQKLAEGASNKVFTATVRSKRVIVKLPDPVVPRRLVTASEVATLEYLRTELDMPVPRVLAWSSTNDNLVGCEYIIMEEVPGEPLDMVWNTSLKGQEKFALVDQVQSMQSRTIKHSSQLGGYGSLYFSKDAKAFGFNKELPVRNKNGPNRFSLGPLAHPKFIHPEVERGGISCGPWTSPEEYLIAAIDCSISKVKSRQEGRKDPELADSCFDFPLDTCSDYSPEAALALLHQYRLAVPSLVPSLSQHSGLAQPVLWHNDLHLGNIFVDPSGNINGIIDWQDTYCLPLFFQAQVPTFSDYYQDSPLFELPHNFSTTPEGDEKKEELGRRFLQTKLRQYYLVRFSEDSSGISKILENPSWAGLRDLAVSVAGRSFTRPADFILLRELLLRIERYWAEIVELSGSWATCPVSIADDELRKHRADGKQWNEFKNMLKNKGIPIDRAGWVHKKDFQKQKEILRQVIGEYLDSLKGEEHRAQFKKNVDQWKLTKYPNHWFGADQVS